MRYVAVDEQTMWIVGGPDLWDGLTEWRPPAGNGALATDMLAAGTLMLEADATAAGYSYPPPPEEPWVQVDPDTMTITGGPYPWNGVGDPPAPGQLTSEASALSSGYAYP